MSHSGAAHEERMRPVALSCPSPSRCVYKYRDNEDGVVCYCIRGPRGERCTHNGVTIREAQLGLFLICESIQIYHLILIKVKWCGL